MMRIDRWLGVPLCFATTCAKALFPSRTTDSSPRSIVFIKLAEQGSTVLARRALESAVSRVGRENVYMMVFEDNRFIVDVLGLIPYDNVIVVQSDSMPALVSSALSGIRKLRELKVEAAVDLEFFARSSALLTWLTGAPVRVGFHAFAGEGPYRGDLMTHRVRYNPHLHAQQTFAVLADAVTWPVEDFPRLDLKPSPPGDILPFFAPGAEEVEVVAGILKRETGRTELPPLILLNANASDLIPLRRWSSESYVELARRILARFPEAFVAFTGASDEAQKVTGLVETIASDRCFSLAGKTTLRQLLVLYGLADVLVTNDSGPAHFASLTPIHTVTLFGPETPALFSAMTPRNTPLWAGLACSPCVSAFNNRQSGCTNNVCMQRISVDQVFEAVSASYAKHRASAMPAREVRFTAAA